MSRTTLTGPEFQPFYAVELLLDSTPLRFWTGYGTRTINGDVYNGIGGLLSISGIEEVTDLSAKSATVTLNGIESTALSVAFTEPVQYRTCNIYFGLRDTGTADQIFGGQVNTVDIADDGETGTIQLSIDSIYITLDRVRPRRYTSESQKSRYSTDTFFDWVSKLQDKQIVWGRKEQS
jgi:hypothetical protein